MKRFLFLILILAVGTGFAQEAKRDPSVVRTYIRSCVGEESIKRIMGHEGGKAFLKRFFTDAAWMEQFAGSGTWSIDPWKGMKEGKELAAKALEALDLLVWNDKDDFIGTPIGRNIATALALNHGPDWTDDKLVRVMECYREWAQDGTLNDDAWNHDVRQWREVVGFGQNASLSVEDLRWIHDFANVPAERYYGICWSCAYRLWNCFGASVHGSMYYAPWAHRWNTQELRYRVGGVCGALSKFGSHCAAAHGIRSFTAGQPGHCAYQLWDYSVGHWGIAYAVTGHTGSHNSLGGLGFAASEEQERFYSNPKRMASEYQRWAGNYESALKVCPGNWCAAVAWYNALEAKKASPTEWQLYGKAVRESFAEMPSQGWQLYRPFLDKLSDRDTKLTAACEGLRTMHESPAHTFEAPYWDEIALEPLNKIFAKDEDARWKLMEAALLGQAKTSTFFRQTVNWGAERLMTDEKTTARFLDLAGGIAARTGASLDFRNMLLKASKTGDLAMFRQVCSLLTKLASDKLPKATTKKWPTELAGGKLLSPDGMLMTSGTSRWDNPLCYPFGLTANGFDSGNMFHTDSETAPWGMVKLPGASELKAITVVNSGGGQNGPRQIPLVIWTSENGSDFTQVFRSDKVQNEWTYEFKTPVKAQYVKVGRDPTANKKDVFHLYKILVYGKKLY